MKMTNQSRHSVTTITGRRIREEKKAKENEEKKREKKRRKVKEMRGER